MSASPSNRASSTHTRTQRALPRNALRSTQRDCQGAFFSNTTVKERSSIASRTHLSRTRFLLFLLSLLLILPACESRDAALNRIAQSAPTAGYDATRAQIESKTTNGLGWLPDAVLIAGERIDAGEQDLTFARAVLDIAKSREGVTNPNSLLYLLSVGALAQRAALVAYERGETELAHALVFAGPRHWQTDYYWRSNPNHDALASIILYHTGQPIEAAERIRDRASLNEDLQQLYNELRRAR